MEERAQQEQMERVLKASAWDLPESAIQPVRLAAPGRQVPLILPANLVGEWRGLVTERGPEGRWVELRLVPVPRSKGRSALLYVGDQPIRVYGGDQRGDPTGDRRS